MKFVAGISSDIHTQRERDMHSILTRVQSRNPMNFRPAAKTELIRSLVRREAFQLFRPSEFPDKGSFPFSFLLSVSSLPYTTVCTTIVFAILLYAVLYHPPPLPWQLIVILPRGPLMAACLCCCSSIDLDLIGTGRTGNGQKGILPR